MKNNYLRLVLLICFFIPSFGLKSQVNSFAISSPDKKIKVEISLHDKIYYQVFYQNKLILQASPLTLKIDNETFGTRPVFQNQNSISVDEKIIPVWGSRSEIINNYNEITLNFAGNYAVKFRAYNEGIAYKFVTNLKKPQVKVYDEEVNYRFSENVKAWVSKHENFETPYSREILSNLKPDQKIYLPTVIEVKDNIKVAITEADLHDYPSLFLRRGSDVENYLLGVFEKYPLTTKRGGYNNYSFVTVVRADYIASTSGTREYPWRIMVISDNDATFTDCDIVFKLSKPSAISETGWIKPGKVSWDWWHDYALTGVDFKSGINTPTYLYHIDFAAKHGIEYIIVDWKWTDKYDLTVINPEVDIKRIINYGKEKKVGVILWCPAFTLYHQMDKALDMFAGFGAAGIKADFFERDDQECIRMYEEIAKAASKRKLLVDFHGSTKPTGLSRTYPNIINYEGVMGNEWNKSLGKITYEHKVIIPFIRGLAGPMDFTPGGMRNVTEGFSLRETLPFVAGTRCNEMALYVLYNEPLKMLCDAPTEYDKEPDIIKFLSKIPTTWDQTQTIKGVIGDHLVTARRTGDVWYLGGITGEEARSFEVDCSFLGEGEYAAEIFSDGVNAYRLGTDYKLEKTRLNRNSILKVEMCKGGGVVARFEKLK